MNHEKIKQLGIKPERVREFLNEINEQEVNICEIVRIKNENNSSGNNI
jgi:hypothetical protein